MKFQLCKRFDYLPKRPCSVISLNVAFFVPILRVLQSAFPVSLSDFVIPMMSQIHLF